jgi:hypothetical protein
VNFNETEDLRTTVKELLRKKVQGLICVSLEIITKPAIRTVMWVQGCATWTRAVGKRPEREREREREKVGDT